MRLIRGLNFLCFDKIKQTSWGYQGEWLASKFESKVKHRGATTLLLSRKRWTRNIYCWFNTHRERAKERAPPPPPLLTPVILQVIEYKLTVRVSYRTRWIIFERIITWPYRSYSSLFLLAEEGMQIHVGFSNILVENLVEYSIERSTRN